MRVRAPRSYQEGEEYLLLNLSLTLDTKPGNVHSTTFHVYACCLDEKNEGILILPNIDKISGRLHVICMKNS
ncbi:Estradiol-like protein [Daphnia magna]|uniref:Estradiol-like protein n=1 Tax=Daphnia magna TaxID=35525 RepID=A0A162SJX4_9CRUS|nr:Estradiol-like protein [Daphnia magna]